MIIIFLFSSVAAASLYFGVGISTRNAPGIPNEDRLIIMGQGLSYSMALVIRIKEREKEA